MSKADGGARLISLLALKDLEGHIVLLLGFFLIFLFSRQLSDLANPRDCNNRVFEFSHAEDQVTEIVRQRNRLHERNGKQTRACPFAKSYRNSDQSDRDAGRGQTKDEIQPTFDDIQEVERCL